MDLIKSKICMLAFVFAIMAMAIVHAQYFSAHEGSVLNRNGKRGYVYGDIFRAQSPPYHAYDNGPFRYQLDKLSTKKGIYKFGKRVNDAENDEAVPFKNYLLREILMEYLANKARTYDNDFSDYEQTVKEKHNVEDGDKKK